MNTKKIPVINRVSKRRLKLLLFAPLMGFLIFVPPLSNLIISKTWAGTFSDADVTIADSRPYSASEGTGDNLQYDFDFTTTVTTGIKQLTIQFCNAASGSCVTPTGMVTTGATRFSDNIAGTGRTDTFTSNGTLTTVITTPTTQSTQAIEVTYTDIRNPSTANSTFFARITTYSDTGTTIIDSAAVAFATLDTDSVTFTANVNPAFTFTLNGLANGVDVNGTTTTIDASGDPNLVDLGTVTAGSAVTAGHEVEIYTNAPVGYQVTVRAETDGPLQDGSNDIDKFTGANSSPTVWSSPAGSSNSNSGFFGYTTEDSSLCTGTSTRFTDGVDTEWAGPITDPGGEEIICTTAALSNGTESTEIGWQIEVNNVQAPGQYQGVMILVATPTY